MINYEDIVKCAVAKLDWIILHEGDANGARLEPWYLETLVQEEIDKELACNKYSFESVANYA